MHVKIKFHKGDILEIKDCSFDFSGNFLIVDTEFKGANLQKIYELSLIKEILYINT